MNLFSRSKACFLFAGAFVLRLLLGFVTEGFTADVETFQMWARLTHECGLSSMYGGDFFLDYPPFYL